MLTSLEQNSPISTDHGCIELQNLPKELCGSPWPEYILKAALLSSLTYFLDGGALYFDTIDGDVFGAIASTNAAFVQVGCFA